jgi:hypothetical protein
VVCVQVLLVGLYLLLCVLYWAWSGLQLVAELRDVLDVKHFINNKLGISDRQVGGAESWARAEGRDIPACWCSNQEQGNACAFTL